MPQLTDFFAKILLDWQTAFATEKYALHLVAALLFFIITLLIEIQGGKRAKQTIAPSLPDVILDRLPVIDLNFLFVETMGTLMTVFFLFQLTRPLNVPFVLATLSLFTLIRRAFLLMTPLGPPKNIIVNHGFKPHHKLAHKLFQGDGDYFFSGHTGLPFLFFLLTPFTPLAAIFLVGSIFMAVAVLYMHVHYSIDVFAAPFIVYSIFMLSRFLFA